MDQQTFLNVFIVVVALALISQTGNGSVRGIPPSMEVTYAEGERAGRFFCRDGRKSIPWSHVNDNYCDCPDGSDEPGTSACPNGKFHCQNRGYKSQFVSSSKVNDGVCDCCDGSDEWETNVCQDTCEDAGKEWRERVIEETKAYIEGAAKKKVFAEEGKRAIHAKEVELGGLNVELGAADKLVESLKGKKEGLEKEEEEEKEKIKQEREAREEQERLEAEQQQPETEDDPAAEQEDPEAVPDVQAQPQEGETDGGDGAGAEPTEPSAEAVEPEPTPEPTPLPEDEYTKPADPPIPPIPGMPNPHDMVKKFQARAKELADAETVEHGADDDDPKADDPPEAAEHRRTSLEDKLAARRERKRQRSAQAAQRDDASDGLLGKVKGAFRSFASIFTGQATAEAEAARKELKDAESKRDDLQRQVDKLKEVIDMDFGPGKEYYPLFHACKTLETREYTYELCPFEKVTQKQKLGGSSQSNLGKWKTGGWADQPGKGRVQEYKNGDGCWQGPARSTTVEYTCGTHTNIISVDEPQKCTYSMLVTTPAACDKEHATALELDAQAVLEAQQHH